jgi:UDP-N-acetylbacillosamine N-acetyltransferase
MARGREVDDGETAKAERDAVAVIEPFAGVVGTAMDDAVHHRRDRGAPFVAAETSAEESCQPAHTLVIERRILARVQSELIIWGASGHARVVADIVRCENRYSIAGFLDDLHPERAGETFEGAPIRGGREQLVGGGRLARLAGGTPAPLVIIAFGDCAARLEAARFVAAKGLELAKAIHPSAVIAASARIGAGSVVAANAVVNPGAVVGANAIINTAASVDHDCVIGDGAHICPGVRLAGNVRVGEASWIGIGAVVADGRTIGSGCVIGAGAVVVSDIPDGVVAFGVPARVTRRNA